jgi:hypothetical protein
MPRTKPHTEADRRGKSYRATTAERAQWAFLLYEAMGADRTLKGLSEIVYMMGIRRCGEKTLNRWSQKFHWQRELLERQAGHAGEVTKAVLDQRKAMEDRHVSVFQMFEKVARESLAHTFDELAKREATGLTGLDLSPETALRLMEGAQRGERLARGEATSKAEVVVQVVGPLVRDIFAVFMAVNVITNDAPEMQRRRLNEFVKRGDEILVGYRVEERTGP